MLFPILLAPNAYVAEELRWRAEEERAIRREDGWLAVAGLTWLKPGINAIGSSPDGAVVLPRGPKSVGVASLADGKVEIHFVDEVSATVDGKAVREAMLASDGSGHASRVEVGGLRLTLIERGHRLGFRLHDPNSPRRLAFKGLRWYPVDPRLRVSARFVPYAKPKTLTITNVLGDVREAPCPGYAEFRLGGKTCRLDAEDQGSSYFFNFNDRTNNRTTYGAGRFLDAAPPKDGRIVLDFNRATNPPCAFTDFATCPLPPKGNQLPVEVRAGALNGHTE